MTRLAYLDASAYVKLVRPEPETGALEDALASSERVSSAVLAVEGVRAAARWGPAYGARAQTGLRDIALIPVDTVVLARAATLKPPQLRSLDAVHIATALGIADHLALYAYDRRLIEAARAHGLEVRSPGQAA